MQRDLRTDAFPRPDVHTYVLPILVGCISFAAAWFGMALTAGIERVAMIWVANAILLAFCLRLPFHTWQRLFLGFALGLFGANVMMANGPVLSLAFALTNSLEVAIVALGMHRLGFGSDFTRPYSLYAFYPLSLFAAFLSGILAAMSVTFLTGAPFWRQFATWFGADTLGLVTLTPLLVSTTWDDVKLQLRGDRAPLNLAIIGAFVFLSYFCFFNEPHHPFLVFPPLVLITFRMGFAGGTAMLTLTGIMLLGATISGFEPLSSFEHSFRDQVLFAQFFLAVTSFTIQQIGSALAERSRLESSLKKSNVELRAEKERAETANAVKSSFLANMSHELRTPLNAIIGFADVMENEMFGPLGAPRYKHYASIIGSSGKHLLELINDVLDLSRLDAGKAKVNDETFDLNEVLSEAASMMTAQATAAGLILQKNLTSGRLEIRADRRRVLQIILNLLANAVKFTPQKGIVALTARRAGRGAEFSVSDTGIGIASDDMEKVLTPFGQVDSSWARKYAGTGLELPLAKQLAELHGGTLTIQSVPNAGTTVTISLPAERVVAFRAVA